MSETPTTPGTLFRYHGYNDRVYMILDKERVKQVLSVIEKSTYPEPVLAITLGSAVPISYIIGWWGSVKDTIELTPEEASAYLAENQS